MAVAAASPATGGEEYGGRVTTFVVLSCVVACSGGFLFGYDLGVSGQFPTSIHTVYCCAQFGIAITGKSTIPLYLAEMAPPQYRGAINSGFELSLSLGILFANMVNYFVLKIKGGWGWRISLSMAAVPAAFLTISAIFLLETPSFMIQRDGNTNQARVLLQKLRGTTSVQKELDDLVCATNISRTSRHPFRDLVFKRKYRPQLAIAIMTPFANQVSGVNVINFYAPVMFRTIGLKESASLLSAMVTRLSYGWSWGPLTYLIPAEVCPLEIRSAGQSVVIAVNFFMTFVVGQTFLAILCHIKSATFVFFGVLICLVTLFVYLFLPETKKVPIEQMDHLWRKHWFWKNIVRREEEEEEEKQSKTITSLSS
nr:unnamed protein product [Digitaria exilis]